MERALRKAVILHEQKHAEAQLRKLSEAIEHGPAAIIITDDFGKMEYVSTPLPRSCAAALPRKDSNLN